ncbi:MAG: radical SAM protein [Thermoplasmataceae archaeon]
MYLMLPETTWKYLSGYDMQRKLLITEIFHSIQGEGPYMGIPMMFIRTNRCNLRCRWCDSTYTFTDGKEVPLQELVETASGCMEEWVCLTGGEPLLQREALDFVRSVTMAGKSVLIETSGSLPVDEYTKLENVVIDMDVKTPSSGEEKSLRLSNLDCLRKTDYIKFVIADEKDYAFASNFILHNDLRCEAVFQPAWGTEIKWIAESVLKDHLRVRVLPQLHKLIWGERRGV